MNRRRFLGTTTLVVAAIGGCLQSGAPGADGEQTGSPSTDTPLGPDGPPVSEDPRDIQLENADNHPHTLSVRVEFQQTVIHNTNYELDANNDLDTRSNAILGPVRKKGYDAQIR